MALRFISSLPSLQRHLADLGEEYSEACLRANRTDLAVAGKSSLSGQGENHPVPLRGRGKGVRGEKATLT